MEVRATHAASFNVSVNRCEGICAGKHSVADYLVTEHGFRKIFLERTASTPAVEKSATQARLPRHDLTNGEEGAKGLMFSTADALLDYVTTRWSERWVTTDIWDDTVLECFQRRPFFLLVSVDAPVSVRWKRFAER